MLQNIILGIIQGVVEWLPVSSEGFLVLAQVQLFGSEEPLRELIRISLFLHLGTFLAALLYFWEDVKNLTFKVFRWKNAEQEEKNVIKFLVTTTLITGLIGGMLLKGLEGVEENFKFTGSAITALIGVLLLGTGYLQLRTRSRKPKDVNSVSVATNGNIKKEGDLKLQDSILLGFMQSFAVMPGFSRSGLTVAGLLLRKFNDETALRLSFLMSLPVVLAGNVFLNINKFTFDANFFWGLLASFLFGFVTIHYLLKLARKINFGFFVLGFGALMIIAAFV